LLRTAKALPVFELFVSFVPFWFQDRRPQTGRMAAENARGGSRDLRWRAQEDFEQKATKVTKGGRPRLLLGKQGHGSAMSLSIDHESPIR
jgi:hypothetical protein